MNAELATRWMDILAEASNSNLSRGFLMEALATTALQEQGPIKILLSLK